MLGEDTHADPVGCLARPGVAVDTTAHVSSAVPRPGVALASRDGGDGLGGDQRGGKEGQTAANGLTGHQRAQLGQKRILAEQVKQQASFPAHYFVPLAPSAYVLSDHRRQLHAWPHPLLLHAQERQLWQSPAQDARIGSIPATQPPHCSDTDIRGSEPADELTAGNEGRHVGVPGL